ncbi:MAG: permease, partial [Proteobacteria bacterium]|nr:permease [Pseudomonadota bacterium]
MPAAHIVLYLVLVLVNVIFAAAWLLHARRQTATTRPMVSDVVIGAGTNFLDTLGIGNFAQITALFKLRGRPAYELIPGT